MNEIVTLIEHLVAGVVLGFILIIVIVSSMGVWTLYLEKHPAIIQKVFCESYLNYEKKI